MKIVADENIPLIDHYFSEHAEIVLKPGRLISRDDLFDADMLLIRSVTKINELLLHHTPVKFVGSTTAGDDHLDTAWLEKNGIVWSIAEGCNSITVAEYVVSVIASLQKKGWLQDSQIRAGVIGVGRIGQLVVNYFKILGFDVVQYDPIVAENNKDFLNTELDYFSDLDLISLHTPLTHSGKYPTYHLIEKKFLQRQKQNCILLNAGRGSVISFDDLKHDGKHLQWCLDVWENEPFIDREVLQHTTIATPHIAGHSIQSKLRGTKMIYEAAIKHHFILPTTKPSLDLFPKKTIAFNHEQVDWRDIVLKMYDPCLTSEEMKKACQTDSTAFDSIRKKWGDRYEFKYINVVDARVDEKNRTYLKKLGILI